MKVMLRDVIWCQFDRTLFRQTERWVKFSFITECIDTAEISLDFVWVIIAAAVDCRFPHYKKENKEHVCYFFQIMIAYK